VWATLEGSEREALAALLESRMALIFMVTVLAFATAAFALRGAFERFVAAPARLLEHTRVALTAGSALVEGTGSESNRGLAQSINELIEGRGQLRDNMQRHVREASRGIEQERNRLAALMSELTQSVVVCNRDGQILLYNQRARAEFRALSASSAVGAGSELIGLGRSIYAIFDARLIEHALSTIDQRRRRGTGNPSAQLITVTPAGQLIRAQVAPVPDATGETTTHDSTSGFVLMLDNVTREIEQETLRDRLLLGLTEGSRASLASLQAAVEMLDLPELEIEMRDRFLGVIREEASAMSERVRTLADATTSQHKTRWPLEDMLGEDLMAAAARRIEALPGLRVSAQTADAQLWLKVESYGVLLALCYLANRLREEFDVQAVQLRLCRSGQRAQLDLVWTGQPLSTETVMSWQIDAIRFGSEAVPFTVRDVIDRHGGEFWFERERVRHELMFRFLLPLADPVLQDEAVLPGESRPEFYDFDLFRATAQTTALEERKLSELSYTVFDTETTGLDPSAGDEILQIGATRIVNGKLLRAECFEQLVDPQRSIPAASIPIHGITPDRVVGQPKIDAVLPAFHAFARDSVLVAHNAAFDMRFLQLKEGISGVRFEQPVLDTLLLSAVVHPNQDSHSLEAIAARLGVDVQGRHTAMGDAIVTAEVFLKLTALLADMGISTLAEARAAAQKTYFARLTY
jgi:DNA polymerase-3 subunit epsilon